mmetsp:Transcript_15156/g.45697  ORF Transcript_15156/g.45697 Transcript_15156/m.45697 type:complete len:234 (-) Transcript_15156:56-757(-)
MVGAQVPIGLPVAPRLRILMLHSFRTSGAIFQEQVRRSGLQNPLNEAAELIYMNAPHAASGDIPQDVAAHFSPPFFEWWNFRKDEDGELSYVGFEEAEASVKQALRQHAPVHGICAFSQGTALTSLFAGWQQKGALSGVQPLRFCIMVGGTPFRLAAHHAECYRDPIDLPSLHLIGDRDFLKKHSETLSTLFVDPVVMRHKGGHAVPALPVEAQDEVRAFLAKQSAKLVQASL